MVFKEGSRCNQVIMAVLINVPIFGYGTAVGWMSPMTLLLQSKNSPLGSPMSDEQVSWLASVSFLTSVPSNYAFAYICDRWGRKIGLLVVTSHLAACWIIKLLSTSMWAFILARAMVGVAMAGCYIVTMVYVREISDDCVRGTLVGLGVLSQTIGNLSLYILGDLLSYRAVLWYCLAIPTLHFAIFLTMPESPSFLIKKGKVDKATQVVAWLRSRKITDPKVTKKMETLLTEQKDDNLTSKFVFKSVLCDKTRRKAFFIALLLTLSREFCGAMLVLSFASNIFKMASTKVSPNKQAIVLGVVQVFGSILASSLVDRVGRKPLLLVTSLISGLSMTGLASWFLVRHIGYDTTCTWVPVTSLCLCIFCDASGLQPICFLVPSELFAFKYRSTVLAMTMGFSDAADFLQMFVFKKVTTSFGVHVMFYFFATVCFVSTVFIVIFVPETKNKTLEEIYERIKPKSRTIASSNVK